MITICSEFFKRVVTSLVLIGGLSLFLFVLPSIYFSILLGIAALYMYFIEWPLLKTKCPVHWSLTGLLYPVLPCAALIYLNQQHHLIAIVVFILTPLFDIASYLVGKRWGSAPLAPSISPGKTWQGFVGGLLAVLIAVMIYGNIQGLSATHRLFLNLFAVVFSITALLGDLFESWLKRKAGVKDSGSLLPGHGGLLDRMDGMLATGLLVFFIYMIF